METNMRYKYNIEKECEDGTLNIYFEECGHYLNVYKEHFTEKIPCMKCYKSGVGEYCYGKKQGILHEKEFKAKCWLCGCEDFMCNLTLIKSESNQIRHSHSKCIELNHGYATKSDAKKNGHKISKNKNIKNTEINIGMSECDEVNKKYNSSLQKSINIFNNKKNKECYFCKENTTSYFSLGDINIKIFCPECFSIFSKIQATDCKILKCETHINKNIINYTRESIIGWKRKSMAMKLIYSDSGNQTDEKLNTLHHFRFRFIDILYTSMRMLKIESESSIIDIDSILLNRLCRMVSMLHYFTGSGVLMYQKDHVKFHEKYGVETVNKEDIINFLKDTYNHVKIEKYFKLLDKSLRHATDTLNNINYKYYKGV